MPENPICADGKCSVGFLRVRVAGERVESEGSLEGLAKGTRLSPVGFVRM